MKIRRGSTKGVVALATALGLVMPSAIAEPLPVDVPGLPAAAAGAVASDNVEFIANFPQITAIGARIKGDYLYSTGVDGLSIYNIALTGLPVLQGRLPLPHWENEDVDTNGKILLISADHLVGSFIGETLGSVVRQTEDEFDILYVIDVSIPQAPILLSRLQVPMAHTVSCVLDCTYAWLAGGGGISVVDLRVPSSPRVAGTFPTSARSTHDVQVDAKGIAWVSGTGGLWGYKPNPQAPTAPTLVAGSYEFDNQFIIHNSLRPHASSWKPAKAWSSPIKKSELVYVTEEDYLPQSNGNCTRDGSFQIGAYRQVGSVKRVVPLARWNLGQGTSGELMESRKGDVAAFCSSHYFDVKDDVAAVGWYEQGMRLLSVKNSSQIRQVGYWRPLNSTAWSAQFVGSYIYVIDLTRGLDVIRFTGNASGPTKKSGPVDPVRRTKPTKEWGLACRLPIAV
jgi:hypothetical protein